MVREVEFSNESEVLHPTKEYTNAPDQAMFEGYLESDCKLLNIKVHVPLSDDSVSQRKLFLYFGNVDYDNKMVDYINIGEKGPDFKVYGEDATDRVYQFDLSQVLIIPRKVYSTGGTSEIVIELYTYESNITTDYGSKTLSVPYSVHNTSKYEYDKSTDGIYRLIMIDFELWSITRSYGYGDIVILEDGSLVMSTISYNTDDPTDPETTTWTTPTDEDIFDYARGTTMYPPLRAIISNVLISRYAKYKLIREALLSTAFKAYDNAQAYEQVLLLQNLRERAKFKLMLHKPIDAAYCLQTLKTASAPMTDTTKIHTYNIKYSSYS
jgi:hypothetical protein